MAEQRHPNPQQQETSESQPMHAQLIKTIAAIAASGSMMLLSGLTLTATIIALTVATPLLVIFSPILVPAAIAVFLIASGFVGSGGLGVAAVSVLAWMYKYVMGEHPVGAGQIDYAKSRFGEKAREIKDGAQHRIDQATA